MARERVELLPPTHIGRRINQQLHQVFARTKRRQMDETPAVARPPGGERVGTRCEEHTRRGDVAADDGELERRVLRVLAALDRRAAQQQQLAQRGLTKIGGPVQRSQAIGVGVSK